jgi:DNA-binding NarL/FixJ family response regulator
MTAPVRVFIVDDHPVVRAGRKELLRPSREIAIVGDAGDGDSAT